MNARSRTKRKQSTIEVTFYFEMYYSLFIHQVHCLMDSCMLCACIISGITELPPLVVVALLQGLLKSSIAVDL